MSTKKVDANQPEIIRFLRQLPGVTVADTHEVGRGFPDISVGYRGHNYFIEIKTADGKLNSREAIWHASWRGQVAIARTIDEAMEIIGYRARVTSTNTTNESRPSSAQSGEW